MHEGLKYLETDNTKGVPIHTKSKILTVRYNILNFG